MKKFLLIAIVLGLFALKTASVSANEGAVELRNTVGAPSRCYAVSVLMQDGQFSVLITCRDLIYPISSDLLTYIVWINPVSGADPVKLGPLGIGKVFFRTKTAFSTVFITQEKSTEVRVPTGPVAMRGNVAAITYLDEPSSPLPPDEELVTPSPTVAPAPASRGISNILKGGGVVTAVSVFIVILMLILIKPFK